MRRIFSLLLLGALLVSFHPVHAQGQPSLSNVEAAIWPEFDQPAVLVIYRMTVSSETSLPTTMTFRIPSAAQEPHAVAVGNTIETVGDTDYTLETEGDWLMVTFPVNAPVIQLEYYDPRLSRDGTARAFTYVWPADYAVENLHVELQRPYDASKLRTTPALKGVSAVEDGLTYYTDDFGAIEQGQPFSLEVEYQKATDVLSVSAISIQPSAPVDENTAGRVSIQSYLPWLMGGFVVLVIAGGLYYYFIGFGQLRTTSRRRHTVSEPDDTEQRYCPQCGTRARSSDRFCRSCGVRLRQNE